MCLLRILPCLAAAAIFPGCRLASVLLPLATSSVLPRELANRRATGLIAQLNSNMMPCVARGRRLPSLMLIAGCLGFTELAHVLVQTPQRPRTHAAIRPRLAIASKPQGSHTAVVRAAATGEMGFQFQAAPLLSTALVFLSWGWLQWKSSQYNAIGDELDVELETLQRLTVEQLTKGDASAGERVAEAQQSVDATRARMEEARTIRGPGGIVARIRLPQRGEAKAFEKGAAPAKRREEPEEEVASRIETLKIFSLGGVALLMVPVFFLSLADPIAPPSPELAARLASELS